MNIGNYISFLCTLLGIDSFKVVFKRSERCFDLDGQSVEPFYFRLGEASVALPELNLVRVNLDIVQGGMIYLALAHEARHLFQYRKALSPMDENAEQWRKDFEEYRNGIYGMKECELDAMTFADYIGNKLFGMYVDDSERIEKMKNEISDEDIWKSLHCKL